MSTINLEQSLLQCWQITDDIEMVYHAMENMTEDERLNALLGLQSLYGLKFEKAWKDFEAVCKERFETNKRVEKMNDILVLLNSKEGQKLLGDPCDCGCPKKVKSKNKTAAMISGLLSELRNI